MNIKLLSRLTAAFTAAVTAVMLTAGSVPAANIPQSDISALSAVLIDMDSCRVIWAKNSRSRLPMASTTKIMTTLLTLESGNLDEEFVVDSYAVHTEGSSMGLQEGDIVTRRALCCGMLLPSGNDAANCAAVSVGGDIPHFAEMMNARAADIGMKDTHFVTPSGLHDPDHYSTAYDMALLASEAMKNPDFAEICGSRNIRLRFGSPPYDRWLKNTNKLLTKYDGCIGVKTGFTDEAGRCLVSAAERNGVRLICVTLNAPDDWNDHTKLLNMGFDKCSKRTYDGRTEISVSVAGGVTDSVKLIPSVSPEYTAIGGADADGVITAPPMIYAPVPKGKEIGTLTLSDRQGVICRIPLIAADSVEAVQLEPSLLDRIKAFFGKLGITTG